MTLNKFKRLYEAYKNNFDLENQIIYAKTTYSELNKKTTIDEAIPF